MKWKCGWVLAVVAVGSLALAPVGWGQDAPDGVNLRRTVVVDVVQRTKDAVVLISAEKMVMQRVSPFAGNPFFQQFGPGEIVQRRANSLGSGFIIHEDGYVVTNNHVIDKARQITVELVDGRKLPATLISADPDADLAILKISDPKPLPVLQLGDSSDLMIGEPAIAVGNPLGYSHTVSTGIVSALHRDLKSSQGEVSLGDLIQTDAAINPGNSGGPLLNAYGQVIGINTAIRQDAQNIGFAIQVNRLRDLIPELMSPAAANKVEVPLALKETRKITEPATITTEVVSADKPARRLLAINGHEPRDIVDAYARLLRVRAGQKLRVSWAGGDEVTLAATAVPAPPTPDVVVQAKKRLGLGIEQVTPVLAKNLGLETEEGLLVTDVQGGSVAANAGIKRGDVMMALGHYRVNTLEDLSALMHYLPQQGDVAITVVRQDTEMTGKLTFGSDSGQQ